MKHNFPKDVSTKNYFDKAKKMLYDTLAANGLDMIEKLLIIKKV